MKLIAQVKLLPTPEQAVILKRTLTVGNAACEFISKQAWQTQTFGQYDLHHLCYRAVREKFKLSAQTTVRCISKVADAYKLDRTVRRRFKPTGSLAYDDRILRWLPDSVSIWTLAGRMTLPFVCGQRQRELLQSRQGESDRVLFRDKFFLSATCDVEEPTPQDMDGILGLDLGVINIAVDSDGERHSACAVNNVRYRHRRLRAKLQRKGTRAAKRRLKALSGREARFAKWTNHTVSQRLVAKAQGTRRGLALEDLTGLRDRVRLRRSQSAARHAGSVFQLRAFLDYPARRVGVPVV